MARNLTPIEPQTGSTKRRPQRAYARQPSPIGVPLPVGRRDAAERRRTRRRPVRWMGLLALLSIGAGAVYWLAASPSGGGTDRLGWYQQRLALGRRSRCRAPTAGHAREGSRPHLPIYHGAARARRANADHSAGRPPRARQRAGDWSCFGLGGAHRGAQRGPSRDRRLRRRSANELGIRAAARLCTRGIRSDPRSLPTL